MGIVLLQEYKYRKTTLSETLPEKITKTIMVLESIDMQNNNNMEVNCGQFVKAKPQSGLTELDMEQHMLAKIMHLLPEGYNLPRDISQYELIMATIQYINALQSLTAQYQ